VSRHVTNALFQTISCTPTQNMVYVSCINIQNLLSFKADFVCDWKITHNKFGVVIELLNSIRHGTVKLIAPKLYEGFLTFEHRTNSPMFEEIKSRELRNLVGAEIGVFKGRNAVRVLEQLDVKKLYLIDPYLPYTDGDGSTVDPVGTYETAKKRLKNHKNAVFIKKYSADAVSMLPQLDFVYIDGNHSFEAVKEDIENYYPLVKENGFFGGHDFYGKFNGVILAVTEFVRREGLTLHSDFHDWWIIKPKKQNS
jgi:hypothetical protein